MTITIPSQGLTDHALSDVVVKGAEVSFAIPGIPGDPRFAGRLTAEGTKISGTFTQGGQSFPFELDRAGDRGAAAQRTLEGFAEFVEESRKKWEVPGLAVAVVSGDAVVFAAGFGHRDVERGLPVTPKTLFAIGSTTKAFTTFTLGTLVDEGKLDWDAPVQKYLPTFQLEDPEIARRITLRDLVTHRSGLPRHDALWYNDTTSTRAEIVARLAHLEATADLRARFQYNNLMYLAAGYVLEVVTGKSWEDNVRERIFTPLGMSGSNFSVLTSQETDDFALPYSERDDQVRRIAFRRIDLVGPAGSINSNLDDMARWLSCNLNRGRSGDRKLIQAATLADIHAPQMVSDRTSDRPDISPASYGLGWVIDTYRGHLRVHHGGGIDGFITKVTLFPNDKIGIVVFANRDGTPLPELLSRHAADRLLELDAIPWSDDAFKREVAALEAQKKGKEAKKKARVEGTRPARALADYAGAYEHAGYGRLVIGTAENGLTATYNGMTAPLEHWHYEVFRGLAAGDETALEDRLLRFDTDMDGNVATLRTVMEPALGEVAFTRIPDPELSDPDYLRLCTGTYEVEGQRATVTLEGARLVVTIPGQPVHQLVPALNRSFTIKGLPAYKVTFLIEEGEVRACLLDQPNGLFRAERIESE